MCHSQRRESHAVYDFAVRELIILIYNNDVVRSFSRDVAIDLKIVINLYINSFREETT